MLGRIAHHKEIRDGERERRAPWYPLSGDHSAPRPIAEIGDVAALANAGVFQRRGDLVGTVACQTYAAMLGVRLSPLPCRRATSTSLSSKMYRLRIQDRTPPVLDVLKEVEKTFRAIPHLVDGR